MRAPTAIGIAAMSVQKPIPITTANPKQISTISIKTRSGQPISLNSSKLSLTFSEFLIIFTPFYLVLVFFTVIILYHKGRHLSTPYDLIFSFNCSLKEKLWHFTDLVNFITMAVPQAVNAELAALCITFFKFFKVVFIVVKVYNIIFVFFFFIVNIVD